MAEHIKASLHPTPEVSSRYLSDSWLPEHTIYHNTVEYQNMSDVSSIIIAHGYKNRLPDPILRQRVFSALMGFFSEQYDRVLLTGGLKKLQDSFVIQPQVAYEHLAAILRTDKLEDALESRGIVIPLNRYEWIKGSKELVFNDHRDLAVLYDGNSFVHEMREVVGKFPQLSRVTSVSEQVAIRSPRLKHVAIEAFKKGYDKSYLQAIPEYDMKIESIPKGMLMDELKYEIPSGIVYLLPAHYRDLIIETMRKKA